MVNPFPLARLRFDAPEHLRAGLTDDDAARLAARLGRDDPEIDAIVAEAWRLGALTAINTLAGRRACRICGCWAMAACPPTCSWVDEDLCSACDPEPAHD